MIDFFRSSTDLLLFPFQAEEYFGEDMLEAGHRARRDDLRRPSSAAMRVVDAKTTGPATDR